MDVDGADILATYQALRDATDRMVRAARNGEWDGMAALERARDQMARALMARGYVVPADPKLARRLADLAGAILSANEELATLTRGQLTEVKGVLDSLGTAKRLEQTYGSQR